MLQFGFNFFVFSFGNDIFDILFDFSASIFSYPITFANNFFCLLRPCKQFFSIFLIRPPKIMVRPLLDLSGAPAG